MGSAHPRYRPRRAEAPLRILDRKAAPQEISRVTIIGPPETYSPLERRPGLLKRTFWRTAWALRWR